jgi:hypothetical protein
MSPATKELIFSQQFMKLVGAFHLSWSAVDQTADYAIWQFLKITPEQSHLITSALMFGRKAQLLVGLISRSEHPRKNEMLTALNFLRGEGKREVITHSYVVSSDDTVTFLHRTGGGYNVKKHTFTLAQFERHVLAVLGAGEDFQKAIGVTLSQLAAFEEAAIKAAKRHSTSDA